MTRLSRQSASVKPSIKEYHFHVYWFQEDTASSKAANDLRKKVVRRVEQGTLVAVCHGVTSSMLPGLDDKKVPQVNNGPKGPHPCGSFEVWVPFEWFDVAMSFFMRERGDLSVLVHPLTKSALLDHTKYAVWLGQPYRLNLSIFGEDSADPPQYEELHLGYSSNDKSCP